MRSFWMILLVALALLPLLLAFRRGSSWRNGLRKSALQAVAEVVPPKFRLVFAFAYLALVLFAAGKVKGLF
jgi:hypothetical protein